MYLSSPRIMAFEILIMDIPPCYHFWVSFVLLFNIFLYINSPFSFYLNACFTLILSKNTNKAKHLKSYLSNTNHTHTKISVKIKIKMLHLSHCGIFGKVSLGSEKAPLCSGLFPPILVRNLVHSMCSISIC